MGYTALLGKGSSDVRSVYRRSIVFPVAGQKCTLLTTLIFISEPNIRKSDKGVPIQSKSLGIVYKQTFKNKWLDRTTTCICMVH